LLSGDLISGDLRGREAELGGSDEVEIDNDGRVRRFGSPECLASDDDDEEEDDEKDDNDDDDDAGEYEEAEAESELEVRDGNRSMGGFDEVVEGDCSEAMPVSSGTSNSYKKRNK
jgi:hypothetical protein